MNGHVLGHGPCLIIYKKTHGKERRLVMQWIIVVGPGGYQAVQRPLRAESRQGLRLPRFNDAGENDVQRAVEKRDLHQIQLYLLLAERIPFLPMHELGGQAEHGKGHCLLRLGRR